MIEKAKHFAAQTDHGHRKGQDHLVKLINWAGYDHNGKPTIKFACLDCDSGGHSIDDAAAAVKKSVDFFLSVVNAMYKKKAEVEAETVSAANTLVSMTNPSADTSTAAAGIDLFSTSADDTIDDDSIDLNEVDTANNIDEDDTGTGTDSLAASSTATVDGSSGAAAAGDTNTEDINWREAKHVWLHTITGDRGGGAAVDKLHKGLIKLWVMEETSNRHVCDMHGLFKALERLPAPRHLESRVSATNLYFRWCTYFRQL